MTILSAARPTAVARPAAPEAATRLAQLGRLLAWVGILVLALYMTVGEGSGWYGIYSVDLRIFTVGSLAVVFAAWALVAWRSPVWRPETRLGAPIVAVLAAFAIATAASWRPRLSADYTAYAVVLVGLYLLLVRLLASPFFRPRLFGFAAALCAGIAAWYLFTVGSIWAHWWGLVGRFAIPPLRPGLDGLSWGSPNTVAIMVILLLPPVLAWYGGAPGRRRVAALAALTALVLVTTFLTGSRGAWLGLGGGLAITVVAWLAVPGHVRTVRNAFARLPIRRGPTALVIALAGIAAGVVAPLVAARVGAGGEDLRAGFLGTAIDMFTSDPVTGSGPGTWVVRRIAFTPADGIDYYVPHAHNVFAQALAEFGLVGVVAGLVLVVWIGALLWDGIRDIDATRRRFAWASVFALAYFALHQLVDVYVGSPCVLFAIALAVGYLDLTSHRSLVHGLGRWTGAGLRTDGRTDARTDHPTDDTARPDAPTANHLRAVVPTAEHSRRTRTAVAGTAALAAVIVAAIAFLGWSESSALPADRAVGFANDGDWTTAATAASTAATSDPDFPAYQFLLGLADLHVGNPAAAAIELQRSAAVDDFPEAWLDLADARVFLGDAAGARDALARALRLGRQQASVAFAAGSLFARLGDRDAAADAFGAAIATAPTLAVDPWFASGPGAPFRDRALAVARATWRPDAWDFPLLAGDPVDARVRAAALPTGAARARALQIIDAVAGDAAAAADIAAAAKASPFDLALVGWSARLARLRGDEAAATRYRDWSDIVSAASGAFGLDLRVSTDLARASAEGSVDAAVYGVYTYRRPMPADLLAPDLPHLHFV